MNGHMDTMSRRRTGGMSVMNMGNIIGDPFALATVSIAMVRFILCAWHILNMEVSC
jgi:SHO1 osmosensor